MFAFVIWVVFVYLGLALWWIIGRRLREVPEESLRVNAFCLCLAILWIIVALVTHNPKIPETAETWFRCGALLVALFFTLQVFYFETSSFFLKLSAAAFIILEIMLLFAVPGRSMRYSIEHLYLSAQGTFASWSICMSGMIVGIMFIFTREVQGDWNIFDFWRRVRRRGLLLNMRLLLIIQVYVSTLAAAISNDPLRKASAMIFFSLLLLIILIGFLTAVLLVYDAIFPIGFLLIPGLCIAGGAGLRTGPSYAQASLGLMIWFFIWSLALYASIGTNMSLSEK